jgi:hypothetical protein
MKYTFAILLFCCINGFSQYSFEKYPSIKYVKAVISDTYQEDKSYVGVIKYNDLKIELLENRQTDSSNIIIYQAGKIIQKIKEVDDIMPIMVIDSAMIGNINNDKQIDFKITLANPGNGFAALMIRKIYLFGNNGKFNKVSFLDFSDQIERDFNNDNNFEIIGVDHIFYKNHSYWIYDLYNYQNRNLINVSQSNNYPIMIQYLYKENYKEFKGCTNDELKKLSKPKPKYYNN